MALQGIFTGGVKVRNLNGYLIAVDGEVFATANTGGTTNAFFYQAKTTTTGIVDPGAGHISWNNSNQTSATAINVNSLTDTPVQDISLFLSAIVPGNKIILQDRDNSANYQIWNVSVLTVWAFYYTINVTLVSSGGIGTTGFSNNHDLLFIIQSGGTGGGITTNAVTFNNSGSGAASGTSFNGATPVTVSYNTFGAQQASAILTALAGLTYGSGTPFVKMTGAGTFALDTNTYITGNQTITLSGDVTGSGATAITTTIANNAVTLAKMAQVATARFLGRVTAGTGNVEALTGTQATTLLDTFTSALKGLAPASGGGTTNFLRADGTWAAPPGGTTTNALTFNNSGSGAVSGATFNGSSAVTISHNTIGAQALNSNLTSLSGLAFASTSFVKMTGANTFALDTNTYLTANQTITLSGDVTGSGSTSISTTIGNNVVTLAKFQQISTASFLGRVTAATGNVEVLTGTQATTLLDVFTSSLKGLTPASGGGTTNFLRADGTWAAPGGGGGGGAFCYDAIGTQNIRPSIGTFTYGCFNTLQDNNILGGNNHVIGNFGTPTAGANVGISCNNTISGGFCNMVCNNTVFIGSGNCPNGCLLFNTIAGGRLNFICGQAVDNTISGGCGNCINGAGYDLANQFVQGNSIGGGVNNCICFQSVLWNSGTSFGTIAGGSLNSMRGGGSFIGGGTQNIAFTHCANAFSPVYNNIVGGFQNSICPAFPNSAFSGASYSTILGGSNNTIITNHSIAFGRNNTIVANCSAILSGCNNQIQFSSGSEEYNIILGGQNNTVTTNNGIVLGGQCNTLTGQYSGVANLCGINASANWTFYFCNICALGNITKAGGTANDYLKADGNIQRISSGTAAPTGGNDGDIYLQYV